MVKPIEPPIVRIESERAAVVASSESGTTISATVALGTKTPPMPKDPSVPIATATDGFVGFDAASAPPNAAVV